MSSATSKNKTNHGKFRMFWVAATMKCVTVHSWTWVHGTHRVSHQRRLAHWLVRCCSSYYEVNHRSDSDDSAQTSRGRTSPARIKHRQTLSVELSAANDRDTHRMTRRHIPTNRNLFATKCNNQCMWKQVYGGLWELVNFQRPCHVNITI